MSSPLYAGERAPAIRWLSLAEAIRLAGSFEALVAGVNDSPRIRTRAELFQMVESGNPWHTDKDNSIPSRWWEECNPRLDNAGFGRILFAAGVPIADGRHPPDDILAMGVEFEPSGCAIKWPSVEPVAPAPTETPKPDPETPKMRDNRGNPGFDGWELLFNYLADFIRDHRDGAPFQTYKAAANEGLRHLNRLAEERRKKGGDTKVPAFNTIREKISQERPDLVRSKAHK